MKKIIVLGFLVISSISPLKAQIYTPSGTIQGTSTNNNVGIGTNTPNAKLYVSGGDIVINNSGTGVLRGDNYNYGSGGALKVNSSNTISEQYIQLGRGLSGTGEFFPHLTVMANSGKVGIGTSTPDAKLTVNGDIHATEVKVTLTVPAPDYVFASDYKLKSLKEVEEYINKNSHLPEIPSAAALEKNGLLLAEMNMSLLKKVEELTLYMIEQSKELETLKKENETFKTLSGRLSNIENQLK